MTEAELNEALRFGTRREYELGELGRYGLGLKTASISQCRRLTVVDATGAHLPAARGEDARPRPHRARPTGGRSSTRPPTRRSHRCLEWLDDAPGTVVFWENLDRVLPERRPEGGWARRRLEQLAERSRDYLGMVFHRFLEGDGARATPADDHRQRREGPAVEPVRAAGGAPASSCPAQSFEVSVGDALRTGHAPTVRPAAPESVLEPRRVRAAERAAEVEPPAGPVHLPRGPADPARRLVRHPGGGRAHEVRPGGAGLPDRPRRRCSRSTSPRCGCRCPPRCGLCSSGRSTSCATAPTPSTGRDAQHGAPKRRAGPSPPKPERRAADAAEIGTALMAAALDAGEHDAFAAHHGQAAVSSTRTR